jgi:hypothetical protein
MSMKCSDGHVRDGGRRRRRPGNGGLTGTNRPRLEAVDRVIEPTSQPGGIRSMLVSSRRSSACWRSKLMSWTRGRSASVGCGVLGPAETPRFIATVLHGYVCVWRRTGLEWD